MQLNPHQQRAADLWACVQVITAILAHFTRGEAPLTLFAGSKVTYLLLGTAALQPVGCFACSKVAVVALGHCGLHLQQAQQHAVLRGQEMSFLP